MTENETSSSVYETGSLPTFRVLVSRMLLTIEFEFPMVIWFILLIALFLLLLHFHRRPKYAALIFLPMAIALGFTGRINEYIIKNSLYSKLGFRQNHFDAAGLFIFIFWGVPLTIMSVIFLLLFFMNVSRSAWDLWINYRTPALAD